MHNMKSTRRLRTLSAIALALAASHARASLSTWSNVTGTWSVSSNWIENATPVAGDSTTLTFGGAGAIGYDAVNDAASTFVVNRVDLNSEITAIGPAAPGISGNPLQFEGVSPMVSQNGGGDFYFRLPVSVNQPIVWQGAGVGNVTFDSALSGFAGITKNGPSAFRLGSPAIGTPSGHTFLGGFTINGGTIRFNNSSDSGRTAARSNRFTMTSPTATLSCISQLRCGELVGTGSVLVQDTPGNGDGHDLTLVALGDGSFSGTINTLPATAIPPAIQSTISGKLNTRGWGIQTFTGLVQINDDMSIGKSSGITLAGTATLAGTTRGITQMHGGSLTLDNSLVNNNNRLRDSGTSATGIENVGGGTFTLIGNIAGTTETIGRLDFGSATAARGGALAVKVVQSSASTAATVLTVAGYQRDSTKNPRGTLDFAASDQNNTVRPLGVAGNSPRILFTSNFTPLLRNGLFSRSNLSANDNVGWATVNGSDFATYGANGVAPVATSAFPAVGNATTNAILTSSAVVATNASFPLNSLKIAPASAGQSLTLSGASALSTNAILLAGANDFSILTDGSSQGSITGPSGARYITVQSAALTVDASMGTSAPLAKAGKGFLILNNATNANSQQPITINEGTLRAAAGSSLTSGVVEFRGGVLELTSPTFSRALGSTPNQINWRNDGTSGGFFPGISDTDKGSGGFSAFGTPVQVALTSNGSSDLIWEDPYFVDGAHALVFGSTRSNARLTFQNNLQLTGAGSIAYNLREVRVIDNPASSQDCTEFSGSIVGSITDDLLKTGDGTLELSGTNSLPGGVVVGEGNLLINSSASIGSGAYAVVGLRSGAADAGLFASNASGVETIDRDISIQVGSSGSASMGTRVAAGNLTVGNVEFVGRIVVGITGSSLPKTVNLVAEAGSVVSFSGVAEKTPGYVGTTTLHKTGSGTVQFAKGLTLADVLVIDQGLIAIAPNGTASGTSKVSALQIGGTSSAPSGKIDIADNALIIDYSGASPLSQVTALVKSAFNGGAWNGNGISSSMVVAGRGLAAIEAPAGTLSFGGMSVDSTAILMHVALKGDTNIDGSVNFSDLLSLAQNYGGSGTWANGDSDYDGAISFTDLLSMAQNYGQSLLVTDANAAANFESDWLLARSLVPEPSLAAIALLGMPLLRRKRLQPEYASKVI